MRHPAPTPSSPSIPLPRERGTRRPVAAAPVHPEPADIERFNALVHELYRDAPQIDADAIASVANWLESHPPEQRDALLRARLDRIAEIEAMQRDRDWPLEPAQVHRIELILDYVAGKNDLIPDDVPTYGHLDDALLLELAWPVLAEDIEDYRDFCQFRQETGDRLGRPVHQLDWLRSRAEEGALWEHMHRVHDQAYVEYRGWSRIFRVT